MLIGDPSDKLDGKSISEDDKWKDRERIPQQRKPSIFIPPHAALYIRGWHANGGASETIAQKDFPFHWRKQTPCRIGGNEELLLILIRGETESITSPSGYCSIIHLSIPAGFGGGEDRGIDFMQVGKIVWGSDSNHCIPGCIHCVTSG